MRSGSRSPKCVLNPFELVPVQTASVHQAGIARSCAGPIHVPPKPPLAVSRTGGDLSHRVLNTSEAQ